ncbi:L-threonylcarbamoyladenylate synthase [Moraxella sp. ZY210820]|uniref:L-threonylcarbamoyladenylate synthase n=1 Tax=unclassified Moraxella TaxID=2685852 RepID=UPI00273208F5|nr:L-threonylcarbamoyladenylate synthase [Moraxella sp. ZY210820]WLF83449.1 threonylcarbamoyl-AMP synthase [Moraxella sp. ZY210820]
MLRLYIHPENPQPRLMQQVVQALNDDKIVIYPTDTCYAIGCKIGNKSGVERISRLLQLNDKYTFSLLCQDLSQVSQYAEVDNQQFRILKTNTPSEIAFILSASKMTPKYLHNKVKQIAIRINQHIINQQLIEQLNEPLLVCDLMVNDEILDDPEQIELQFDKLVDVFIDNGYGMSMSSTLVDISTGEIQVLSQGLGEIN